MLTPEDIPEPNIDTSDEVENLQNSLREAVHDENVQPKMQCLMMDSSFSMVTMQGEDSGIEWETTPSRSTTPWASEAGSPLVESGASMSPAPPAGKIIFVMDEELISRQKKTKERGPKGKAETRPEVVLGSLDNISGRPELVSFSEPNVKADTEEIEEEITDPSLAKEQKLFRLVSEGSEILNIIVPPKIATVDEEESKEMEDNLSYLEASPVVKVNDEIQEQQFEMLYEPAPELANVPPAMDPPGAPVPKPAIKQPPSNVDYFEAFALIDAQAPGSPAVNKHGKTESIATQETETPGPTNIPSTIAASSVDDNNADNISLVELTSELLDEVFYGTTNDVKATEKTDSSRNVPSRLSFKKSGSALFGSQEEILTPIYLPEGPPKIIDPILLEEPKAMAFLYTDLYEEATGSRKKEEDTESLSSEKSFHSRHSDREARGYLEKYVLIDETPAIEVPVPEIQKVSCPEPSPRVISEDLYDIDNFVSKPENLPDCEEEVTDFFRSSASSSPCVLEPSPQSFEEDQIETKPKAKKSKSVVIVAEKPPESTTTTSMTELDDPDWECAFDDILSTDKEVEIVHTTTVQPQMEVPVAPPRKKLSTRKACLDLTPLTPVDDQEEEKPGCKEQCVEEKETASPPETADEGDGEETFISQKTKTTTEETPTNDLEVKSEITESNSQDDILKDLNEAINEVTETEGNAPEEVTESTIMETVAEMSTVTNEPVNKGQCIIL